MVADQRVAMLRDLLARLFALLGFVKNRGQDEAAGDQHQGDEGEVILFHS